MRRALTLRSITAALLCSSCCVSHGTSEIVPDDECLSGDSSCTLSALQLRAAPVLSSGVPMEDLIKGISYGPMPCKGKCDIHMDDFFGEASKPMWGQRGRADLQVIRDLGANHVRLYGNNPESDHGSFLHEAETVGLSVVVGMSDYPYTQMQHNCMSTGFDCYEVIKGVYLMNLLKGFLTEWKQYRSCLKHVIVINEPDLKLPGITEPKKFAKGIISAIDGMLDAEKEAGVEGPLVNFTATFSFGICPNCKSFSAQPALGQMFELREAMLNPKAYGYTPRNNLTAAYYGRVINSFNTAAPADYVNRSFVVPYEAAFPATPVVVEEYHTPGKNAQTDLEGMVRTARMSSLLLGVSFFEFQVRYDKGGSEMEFGMFGLGDYSVNNFDYFGGDFHSWCLTAVEDKRFGKVPSLVAAAYGGRAPNYQKLCSPDPDKVELNQDGFQQIASQGPASIEKFASRLLQHMGGEALDAQGLMVFAEGLEHGISFVQLLERLKALSGVSWNTDARKCVADRLATLEALGEAIGSACSQSFFNCSTEVPTECNASVWEKADYIFTKYYEVVGGDPLTNCYFNGSAIFAGKEYVGRKCGAQCCSYTGSQPILPTQPPTLPPIFRTASAPQHTGNPAPPPAVIGDCSFQVQPVVPYFWDESCMQRGGVGCMADGKHLACRYCGQQGFPQCPGPDGKVFVSTSTAPVMPKLRSVHAGDCSFQREPEIEYFWDVSCKDKGGVGCMADGKHIECRYCGGRFGKCPGEQSPKENGEENEGKPSEPSKAPPAPLSEDARGECSFLRPPPGNKYFWDESCSPHGGIGCNADGKHMECRFCDREGMPRCPST